MEILLGSSSPRRQEILRFFSIPFTQISPSFAEETVTFLGNPIEYTETLSCKKAEVLAFCYPDKAILTADTTVFCKGIIYNKPENKQQAISFLENLSGSWHSVFTSLTLFHKGIFSTLTEETKILFRPLSSEKIRLYVEQIRFSDKAGGYAIQQSGALAIEKIEGCYYNVMGLPLGSLDKLLLSIGINLWEHMRPI